MTREEIISEVNKVIAEEFEVEESTIKADGDLKETLNLDSLNLVDLVAVVEYTYKIKIPVADLRTIRTFNDLYDYIHAHQQK